MNYCLHALIVALSLATCCQGASNEQLITKLKDKDWRVRAQAAEELGKNREEKAIAPLLAAICDDDVDVVAAASKALVMIGQPAVPGLILAMKDDPFCFNTEPGIAGASKALVMMGGNGLWTSHRVAGGTEIAESAPTPRRFSVRSVAPKR